ncbi:MAG: molybdopterin cofactor-binding domain-containing protein, partial [Pseudomonadota bacterium]
MTTNNTTGESIKRKEDLRFITGAGRYTDDVSLARQTYAYFVRSPYAHARILSVDTNGALQSPGVITVLTGQDYTDAGLGMLGCGWMIHSKDGTPMKMGERPALARDRVRYVGDHVAVVIAETRQQAKDGAEKVLVDYDDLPAVVDVSMAQAVDAPQLHDIASNNTIFAWELGDVEAVDKAFEQAAHKVSLDFTNNRLIPNAMEPRATNATYEPSTERLTVYLSSQNPHGMRMMLSAAIGLAPEHKLRVISEDVGGGFGSKAFNYPEEIVCAWAAKTLARPVKWTAERSEAF